MNKVILRASQLRIGNFLEFSNGIQPTKIISVGRRFFSSAAIEREDGDFDITPYYRPIPINKDWLHKLGFKLSPYANTTYLPITDLNAEIHFEDFRGGIVCVIHCSTGSFIPKDVKYVHQLQNLYHSLTHEELPSYNISPP